LQNRPVQFVIFGGQRGNPVIFDLRYRPEMLALRGDVGCKSILARHPQAVLEVEMPTASILEDVDTMEAYKRIAAHFAPAGNDAAP
jgi:molybdenum cofactor cytidylyltransferase